MNATSGSKERRAARARAQKHARAAKAGRRLATPAPDADKPTFMLIASTPGQLDALELAPAEYVALRALVLAMRTAEALGEGRVRVADLTGKDAGALLGKLLGEGKPA